MKKVIAALAFALASFTASASFIPLPGSLMPGVDTGTYGEQTCPPPVGCVEAGNTLLSFNVVNTPGTISLAFIGVLDPSSTGFYTFNVIVRDAALNILAAGMGSPSLLIPSFAVAIANGYTIDIAWTFTGDGTTQTASWGVIAATAASSVPEPGTLALVSLGLIGLAGVARKRKGVA